MLGDLRLACIPLLTASIPLLVLARFRYSEFPAWLAEEQPEQINRLLIEFLQQAGATTL
jgi:hypothetical protein